MYLKSLKLVGFKSFADRTRLEFRPGVTVIVGPNGSGKSNVVDALSWVLGSQSPKSLRTLKMEDVIFAGTATRPALNRAEATLVIDNTERRIDLDLDEVAITRRLYRDGSSDYELNGVGCRLLDIQDLLSDSGVGRHQHVIIGQGEIGQVLNASPEDHRAVIEEAAGILKHKRRKERAERRLERTDEDLTRLNDIVSEIARQVRPLKRQAKAAEVYEDHRDEVKALRLYLGGVAIASHDRELTILTSEKSRITEELQVHVAQLTALSERLVMLDSSVGEIASALERTTAAAAVLETTTERMRRIASVAAERKRASTGRIEADNQRRLDLSSELEAIEAEMSETLDQRVGAETAVSTSEELFRRLEEQERSLATQSALSPEGALAAARGELSSIEGALSRDLRERDSIDRRIDTLRGQAEDESAEVGRLTLEIQSLDSDVGLLQSVYEQAANERRRRQELWETAEQQLAAARVSVASATARVDAIRQALSGHFDEAARERALGSAGSIGLLAGALDVPVGLELAVQAALEGWADAVAFDSAASLRAAVESVKKSGGGTVPLFMARSGKSSTAAEVAKQLGLSTLIDSLGPAADLGLARGAIGDVILVEGWAAGWEIVSRHTEVKAVTPEGDLVSRHGVRLADAEGAGVVMLETAEVALERAETEVLRARSVQTTARRDFEAGREKERTALEALERVETSLAGRSEAMGRFSRSIKAIEGELTRLSDRRSAIVEALNWAEDQVLQLESRLASLEGEEAERMRLWEDLDERRRQAAAHRETARSEWQEATGRLRAIQERQKLLEERLVRIAVEMERLDDGQPISGDPERLTMVENSARVATHLIEGHIGLLRERQSELRARYAESVDGRDSARSEHETRREAVDLGRQRTADIDIRLTELRLLKEAVAESVRRDADADIDTAVMAPRPDVETDTDLEALLVTKLAQLSRLGPINPLAAAEYGELSERYRFMSEQMADVESSRAELRKVIAALDHEIRDRFNSAFLEVANAYERYFEILFPGGKGRMRLVDVDAPDSGVVIDAQPLGKKVSQMTLLSGGERSLAALAFLFAIFESRPSPFYVLDEVEAALDDANLRRFIKVVDEFRTRAQLIVVTHQQQTIEAADVLYGVTMEPGGASQALRKDMSRVTLDIVA